MTPFHQLPWYAQWCVLAHGDQMYGDQPYQFHLEAVVSVAIEFGFTSPHVLMTCWGHDVGEDTKKTRSDMLYVGFPVPVVDGIDAVTDEPGETRAERKAKTLPKIAANRLGLIAKLCDRIANVRQSKATSPKKYATYKYEHAEFVRVLYDPSDIELAPLWAHLNSLLAD